MRRWVAPLSFACEVRLIQSLAEEAATKDDLILSIVTVTHTPAL
jgi:hypothetical protein